MFSYNLNLNTPFQEINLTNQKYGLTGFISPVHTAAELWLINWEGVCSRCQNARC
ncbi:hypothetical protein FDUTEX481_07224 [Tolypothrix sp. PCC 7601]|nr:hypothetical protein FDUTEX481_07224 [Tolypothrix sp. PCC 7601]